jgi:exonuclease VII small subunit
MKGAITKNTGARAGTLGTFAGLHAEHSHDPRHHPVAAAAEVEHSRDWWPQMLAFTGDSERRKHLLHFCSLLEGGSGMTTVVRILEGTGVTMLKDREEAEASLRDEIDAKGVKMFPLVVVSPDSRDAVQVLVQSFGVGPVKVNTVVTNRLEEGPSWMSGLREKNYSLYLRTAFRLGCNLVILDAGHEEWTALEERPSAERRIDVWWRGGATSRLMLLLAYLMTRSAPWEDAKIRMLALENEAGDSTGPSMAHPPEALPRDADAGLTEPSSEGKGSPETNPVVARLNEMLEDVRIDAEVKVLPEAGRKDMAELSRDASLVFMPFRIREGEALSVSGLKMDEVLKGLGVVAMVMAAEDIDLEAEPEEGRQAEMACAWDELQKAGKRLSKARRELDAASGEAEKLRNSYREAQSGPERRDELEKIGESLEQGEQLLEQAHRKVAKAEAKEREAVHDSEELGLRQQCGDPEGAVGESEDDRPA